jgi:hypothetical protein
MTEVIVRFLMQLVITVAGFWIYLARSQSSDAGLILYIPFFLGIPGLVVLLLVFAPLERLGVWMGRRWLFLAFIPLVGAAIPWALYPFAGNTQNFLNGVAMLSPIGFIWGLVWIATWPIYAAFSPRPDGST